MDRETHSRLTALARETGFVHVPSRQWRIFGGQLDPFTGVQDVFCKWKPGFFRNEDIQTDRSLHPDAKIIRYNLLAANYHYCYDGK